MRVVMAECIHCGITYRWQASGSSKPGPYNDHEYCEGCKKAIVDALNVIPIKFKYEFVNTNEVTIHDLLRWEKEITEEHDLKMKEANASGQAVFPMMRRVFASLYDTKNEEYSVSGSVSGRDGIFVGRNYGYFYWPSKLEDADITVEKRVNQETKEEISYKLYKNI